MTLPDLKSTFAPKQEKPLDWLFEMAETDPHRLIDMVLPYGKLARALAYNAIQKAHPDFFPTDQVEVPVEKI